MSKSAVKYRRNDIGFTLIELMIVMAVVALLMGLVGPLTLQQLEKSEAKTELISFQNNLKYISKSAYLTGQNFYLNLNGKEVTIRNINSSAIIKSITYKHLFFKERDLLFNQYGFIQDNNPISIHIRNKSVTLEIFDLINKPYRFE